MFSSVNMAVFGAQRVNIAAVCILLNVHANRSFLSFYVIAPYINGNLKEK